MGAGKKAGFRSIAGSVSEDIVQAAIHGCPYAMEKVILFYRPYLRKLSRVSARDQYGRRIKYVDAEILFELEQHLRQKVLEFKIPVTE